MGDLHHSCMTGDELVAVIRAAVVNVFEERSRIDAETHQKHHAWLDARIERDEAVKKMCWSVTTAVAQWTVVGLVSAAVYWIGHHFYFRAQ